MKHKIERADGEKGDKRVINMYVADDGNFLSPFSAAGYHVISGETAEFLDHNYKRHLTDNDLRLIIASDVIDDGERIVYTNAIRNYYQTEFKETKRELHKNFIQSVVMTIVSAIVFAIAITLGTTTQTSDVILNMLDVFAWVFMWEAVDLFFLQRPVLKKKQRKNTEFINAEILFTSGSDNSVSD